MSCTVKRVEFLPFITSEILPPSITTPLLVRNCVIAGVDDGVIEEGGFGGKCRRGDHEP